jgi:hypothetical protein
MRVVANAIKPILDKMRLLKGSFGYSSTRLALARAQAQQDEAINDERAMTLEQALAFKIYGKALRDMKSPSDWRRLFRKIEEQEELMDVFWRHQWDDSMDQSAHASADRLADLEQALRVIGVFDR